MRSQNERKSIGSTSDYRELQILTEVEKSPDVSQRELASRIGLALGLTNVLLRNLVHKGYIKIARASWKRRLYSLTPEGFSHRLGLMAKYVRRFLSHYRTVRSMLREQLKPFDFNSESKIAIIGTGEFAELVFLALREVGIEEFDFYDELPASGKRFLGTPVHDTTKLHPGDYDRLVIASLGDTQSSREALIGRGVPEEAVVTFF